MTTTLHCANTDCGFAPLKSGFCDSCQAAWVRVLSTELLLPSEAEERPATWYREAVHFELTLQQAWELRAVVIERCRRNAQNAAAFANPEYLRHMEHLVNLEPKGWWHRWGAQLVVAAGAALLIIAVLR